MMDAVYVMRHRGSSAWPPPVHTILCLSKPASYQRLATGLLAHICADKSGKCHSSWVIGKQIAVKHTATVWLQTKHVTMSHVSVGPVLQLSWQASK